MNIIENLKASVDELVSSSDGITYQDLCDKVESNIRDCFFSGIDEVKVVKSIQFFFFKPIDKYLKSYNFSELGKTKLIVNPPTSELRLGDKLSSITSLKRKILEDYKEVLFGVEVFSREIQIVKRGRLDLLIKPYEETDLVGLYMLIGLPRFKDEINKTVSDIKLYFEYNSVLLDLQKFKQEVYLFVSKVNIKIIELEEQIYTQENKINEIKSQKHKFKGKLTFTGKTGSTVIDGGEHFLDIIANNENELEKYMIHKKALIDVTSYFRSSYNWYGEMETLQEVQTVIKGADIRFFSEFYSCFKVFLKPHVSERQFINIFKLDEVIEKKVQFVNGTNNDYCAIIELMHQYFIDSVKHRRHYNQWWCDRFIFNHGQEKTKDQLSNIRSNYRNDPYRTPSLKEEIDEIESFLTESLTNPSE